LYLSDSQDEKLKNLLNSFNADKERLEELGIPNKLCLLLYGEPGTGKTTTIITTASYFGRDIFYVSLKNISNNDLKMIFDYVNEKHSNQGIIVLEDFDAMTNVVSKRSNNYNNNNNNQEDLTTLLDNLDLGLTLDFFLNVLDESLTSNNSIVIMTTNHLEKIDPAIYRAGRVDSLIEMKKSDYTQIKKMFKRFISRDIDEKILSQIEEFKYEPAKIIFRLKEFIKKTDLSDEEIMRPFISK
jgi:mitochondrial chaperone BCS1